MASIERRTKLHNRLNRHSKSISENPTSMNDVKRKNSQQTVSRVCLSVINARFDKPVASITQKRVKATEFSKRSSVRQEYLFSKIFVITQ